MKTPNEAYRPDNNESNSLAIERHIDKHLSLPPTEISGARVWMIPTTRSGWTTGEILQVLARYREVGWTTMLGGSRDVMCCLSDES